MIDRTEFDLRLAAHARLARDVAGHAWRRPASPPPAAPRVALATASRRLAARLDPTAAGAALAAALARVGIARV
jgi:hypothetical protein